MAKYLFTFFWLKGATRSEIDAMPLTAGLQEICEKIFNIVDINKNGFIEQNEYDKFTLKMYSLLLPQSRWKWTNPNSDLKITMSEWLEGMEAFAEFVGEGESIAVFKNWCALNPGEDGLDALVEQLQAVRPGATVNVFAEVGGGTAPDVPNIRAEELTVIATYTNPPQARPLNED